MIGIYYIKNTSNNKIYIGQSVDVKNRLRNHKWALRHNRHINDHLQKSWNKYGEDNFEFDIICECDENQLDDLERYYISYYSSINPSNGYNHETGGNKNKRLSKETVQKLKNRMGKNSSMWGKHHSAETKQIMREKKLGKKLSDETKRKLSESHKGKLSKPLYCIELDIEFPSSLEATEYLGLKSRSGIFECISGRKKSCGKHPETGDPLHWIYLEDKIS